MKNELLTFAAQFAVAIATAAAKTGAPVFLGLAKDCADAVWHLAETELNGDAEMRSEAEADALNFFKTAWEVLKQEAEILKDDLPVLIAQATSARVKEALGLT